MSSLTTAGSSMEECSAEYNDTRLSLEIGENARAPPQRQMTAAVRLFGELISPQDHGGGRVDHRAPAAGRKRRAECGGVASYGRQLNKKQVMMRTLQADEDDGDRRSPMSDGGSRKKLRLTSAQATMLEDTFRTHNILSHVRSISFPRLHIRINLLDRSIFAQSEEKKLDRLDHSLNDE
jgi:homeobox-leucine zipper protein